MTLHRLSTPYYYGGRLGAKLVKAGLPLALLNLAATNSHAANYDVRWDPRVEAGALYDDNYQLDAGADNEVDVAGPFVDAQLKLRLRSQVSEFTVVPRLRSTYFPDESDEDSNDQFLTVDYINRGEIAQLGFNGTCSRQSVENSERPTADVGDLGLGNQPGVDTGFVSVRSRQRLCQAGPRVSFELTDTRRIELNAQYLDVDYSGNPGNGAPVGFSSLSGTLGFAADLTASGTLRAKFVGSKFEPDTMVNPDSDTFGVQFEWMQRSSETFEGYLRAGIERVNTDVNSSGGDELETDNYVFGAGIRREFLVTQLFVDASRSVAPSGTGVAITRNQLRLRVTRDLRPTLSGFVSALGVDDTAAEDDVGFRDRRYAVGSLGLEWNFSKRFALVGQYDRTWQEFQRDDGSATSNQVTLSLVYEPNRLLQ